MVGSLSATDLDAADTHTFAVVGDPRFEVVGTTLKLRDVVSVLPPPRHRPT